MARNEQTPEQLDAIAKDLMEASKTMSSISQMMRDGTMPHALIHGTTAITRYLPSLLEWTDKTFADVKAQLRSYRDGVQSNAEFQKQQNEALKKAAAKKPFTPKAAKKKSG